MYIFSGYYKQIEINELHGVIPKSQPQGRKARIGIDVEINSRMSWLGVCGKV